jgi:hypothetical protein
MSPHPDVAAVGVRDDYDRLRGRLFELLEAMGLTVRQEQAAKRLIRSITYESQASVEAALSERNGNHAR